MSNHTTQKLISDKLSAELGYPIEVTVSRSPDGWLGPDFEIPLVFIEVLYAGKKLLCAWERPAWESATKTDRVDVTVAYLLKEANG